VLGRPDIDAETLAAKHQFPVKKMVARHRAKILTPHGPRTCYEARIERDGKAAGRPVRRDTPRTRQETVITDRIPAWIPAPATTSSTTCSRRRNGVNHQRATCTQRCPRGSAGGRAEKDQPTTWHLAARPTQYRHDRARRTLRGIDDLVAKAEQAVAGDA
jgi:hypothetical protein